MNFSVQTAHELSGSVHYANAGAPMTRQQPMRLTASIYSDAAMEPIRMPCIIRAGLRYASQDPLSCVLDCLARIGLDDPEQLRARWTLPAASLICRVVPNASWAAEASALTDEKVLEQALVLGLCTQWQYDPRRPVLWTSASLTRCVELHDPARFYA